VYIRGAEFGNDASLWTVDTVVQNNSCRRTVSTRFQFAPAQFRFTAYTVMLTHGGDRWHRVAHNQQKLLRVHEVR